MPNQAETWFLSFALFAYDPTASIKSNFDRLSSQRKWGEKLRRKHWKNCQAASAALDHGDADNNVHSQIPSRAGTWFQKFPPFVYDPTAGIRSNFERLAAQRNWVGKTAKKRWADCQAEEFGYAYGADTTKLETWQSLCREVHISDPPDSINQCKKVLGSRNVLVNLVNLIDHRNIGVEVIRFENYKKFRDDCSTPPPSDNGSDDQDHDYFAQDEFHGFVPNPEDDLVAKLSKLSIHQGWSKKEEKRRRAEVVEFEVLRHYGPDKSSLAKWQELCRDVQIEPIPPSITQCRKALSRVHVNIFNILDHRNDPERYPVIVFKNYKTFRTYTLKNRIFPLDQAKEEGFVRALLRPILMNKRN
ncbi:hypothetical protein ACET3X_000837 [Alternaria dauci]|uniref:Uncharacterized protein n=1 Tax=Alternaria dauci TaxID=48095 RepID=A0ABR3UWL9_9PLEO